jgi:AraC family transcriptional regulator
MAAPAFQPTVHRLSHIAEGRLREDPGVLLHSSAGTSWAGFPIERHAVVSGLERRLFWPTARLGLVASGAFTLEETRFGRQRRFVAGVDTVTVWPGGHESASLRWSGSGEIIDVEIALLPLAVSEPELGDAQLGVQLGVRDPDLARMIRVMEAEVRLGCPSGRLFGESLSIAIGAYLVSRYAVGSGGPHARGRGITRRRLSRVLDYIHADLGRDLSVADLAKIAELTPSRFTQVFRAAVGMSPHQYVLRQRIAEAKRLLTEDGMSIAEVAFAVGFASQSHFGHTFRRLVGQTPRRYRQAS